MSNLKNKVFCIGFHKTGTKSLALSLKQLGFNVKGPFGINNPNIGQVALSKAKNFIQIFDAFQDNPWPMLYKELDKLYPNSKFILTIRDTDSWIKSITSYFGNENTEMRKWIYGYGSPMGNENIYINKYTNHNNGVKKYFQSRQSDLLIMNLSESLGWIDLCQFLKIKNIPKESFPHENKSTLS